MKKGECKVTTSLLYLLFSIYVTTKYNFIFNIFNVVTFQTSKLDIKLK